MPPDDDTGISGEANELHVVIVEAKDLEAADSSLISKATSDPFVRLKFGPKKRRTKTVHNCLSPTWNETLVFGIRDDSGPLLELEVRDADDFGRDESLGKTTVELSSLGRRWKDVWLPLEQGELHVLVKKIRSEKRANATIVNAPLTQHTWINLGIAAVLGVFWLVLALGAIILNLIAFMMEFVACKTITLVVKVVSGFDVRLKGLSLRLGLPSEFVLHGLQVDNPHGTYRAPYVLRLDRIDVRLDTQALRSRVVRFDLIFTGLTFYSEKEQSPLSSKEEMLNIWAFVGGPPEPADDDQLPVVEEEDDQEETTGLLPPAAMGVNFKFYTSCFLINGITLYLNDLVSDILGDSDGGDVRSETPIHIQSVLVDADDLGTPEPMWLRDLVTIIAKEILAKLPYTQIVSTTLLAVSSTYLGHQSEALDKIGDALNGMKRAFFGKKKSTKPKNYRTTS